ncbi:energy-coupling factor transporter transmembrane protein EcfT [uncultured Methanolobus sp.]|uniref:energy-coupling factor transporter transmembrane component T family protein n=1 Tax=uncultured Methanolobus sp. TaxID=218300 RepID=UPI0029C8AB58|nr:energy-coupling factor transporter transmembrane protein EcfT [uncultured Methanolobus sp.]
MDNLFLSFIPGDSILHRLDPRTKILGLMLASICILEASSFEEIALITLVFMFLLVACKLPLRHFARSVRPMMLFFLLLFLMQLFFTEGTAIFHFKWLTASYEGLILGTILTLRFIFLLLFAALLTATTSPSKITAGIERLLRPLPLKYIGITSHDLAMMMSLSIYFVPMLYDNFRTLRDAQLSRGLDIKKEPVKAIFSFSVPLISISVRAVEEVALAMESRCYVGTGRTSMHVLELKSSDYLSLILYGILFVFCIVL